MLISLEVGRGRVPPLTYRLILARRSTASLVLDAAKSSGIVTIWIQVLGALLAALVTMTLRLVLHHDIVEPVLAGIVVAVLVYCLSQLYRFY